MTTAGDRHLGRGVKIDRTERCLRLHRQEDHYARGAAQAFRSGDPRRMEEYLERAEAASAAISRLGTAR